MNPYKLFLKSIYHLYSEVLSEKEIPFFYTSILSTAVFYFNIIVIDRYILKADYLSEINFQWHTLLMVFLFALNYFSIFKNKAELVTGSQVDKPIFYVAIIYVVASLLCPIILSLF